MKTEIKKIVYEDITLSDDNVEEIVLKYLEGLLYPGAFLSQDGKRLMIQDEHYHGSVLDSDVGAASDMQQSAGAMIKFIKQKQKEKQRK